MKTRILTLILIFALSSMAGELNAQSLLVSPELKELIGLSVNKDRKVAEKQIEKQISAVQQNAIRSAYVPKIEIGGKYLFAYSSVNSNIGDIGGFEGVSKLQEFMKNPAFPVMFPSLAGLAGEITKLEQLLAQQGMSVPTITKDLDGQMYGNYFGIDATAKMLLYSGGQGFS